MDSYEHARRIAEIMERDRRERADRTGSARAGGAARFRARGRNLTPRTVPWTPQATVQSQEERSFKRGCPS